MGTDDSGVVVAELAELPVDLRSGLVYEFGWQSWSPSTTYPVTAPSSHRPLAQKPGPHSGWRRERPRPARGFQGEGLLACQPHVGGPVHVWSAVDGRREVPSIRAELVGDQLSVSSTSAVEHFVDSGLDGLQGALARFADRYVGRTQPVQVRSIPTVWASWYHYFTEFTEQDLEENLGEIRAHELDVEVIRLDDAFQAEIGDWLAPSTRFPSVSRALSRISDVGFVPGIWIAPFLVGARSQLFVDHPDWLVRDAVGDPLVALWNWDQSCFVLDTTHPGARDYLRTVFMSFRSMGVGYVMIDFAYAGALEGRRHVDVDGIAAYRAALDDIRRWIGEDAFLQACGAPMFPSVGLVDSMRVAPDTAPQWAPPFGDMSQASQLASNVTTRGRAFTHGRFWNNDPDCFMVRPEIERRQELAAMIAKYGPVRISSDRIRDLDRWGLDTTRELLVRSDVRPLSPSELAF